MLLLFSYVFLVGNLYSLLLLTSLLLPYGVTYLYICNGIMFPSPPLPPLYVTVITTLFDIFQFAVIMEQFLLKLMEFVFTMSL